MSKGKKKIFNLGLGIWESTCLEYIRPWVQSLAAHAHTYLPFVLAIRQGTDTSQETSFKTLV
jgi:hypothetical protein